MFCIAIAVKTTSKGPIIFKQRRYGLDGEIIVYKFRSMRVMEDAAVVTKPARVTHGLPKWVLSCVNHHWMSCRSFSTFCRKNEHCRSTPARGCAQ
jgi:hypothetical protein